MIGNGLSFLFGLLVSVAVFPAQGGDSLRFRALHVEDPLLAAVLFYAVPFLPAYLMMTLSCRLSLGVAWLSGWMFGELGLAVLNCDDYLRCSAWGCGTGARRWLAGTMLAPSALGKLTALAGHWMRRRTRSAPTVSGTRNALERALLVLLAPTITPVSGELASELLASWPGPWSLAVGLLLGIVCGTCLFYAVAPENRAAIWAARFSAALAGVAVVYAFLRLQDVSTPWHRSGLDAVWLCLVLSSPILAVAMTLLPAEGLRRRAIHES